VTVTDTVIGDAMMVGQDLDFSGMTAGSYLGAGGGQRIGGRIDGSVRAAGAAVEVQAQVGRNATLAGGTVVVGDRAAIQGNAYLAGREVRVSGTVEGSLYAGAAQVLLDGVVSGDVRVEASAITIGPSARIEGEVRYRIREGTAITVSPLAVLSNGLVELEARPRRGNGELGLAIVRLLGFVVSCLAVAVLFPRRLTRAMNELRTRPGPALWRGLAVVLLGPLTIAIIATTVVGIPVAAIGAAAYAASLYLSPVVVGLWLGDEMIRSREPTDRGSTVLLAGIGGVVVAFAILLPWVGFVVRVLAICAGLGAVVLMIEHRHTTGTPPVSIPDPGVE
jgi:cytoskeletal protein CcmA (bactofilin family)